jgi:succinyl-CoA synthetase beta subunit
MGLILEYEGKEYLFKKYKIPLLEYRLVMSRGEAEKAIDEIGAPVVVKAQILSGGRGKMGLVKFSKTKEDALKNYDEITVREFEERQIDHIMIEAGADIKQEIFVSMVWDNNGDIVILFSDQGGVDIEKLAEEEPDKIETFRIPFGDEIFPYVFMAGIERRGIKGKSKLQVARIMSTLVDMMRKEDLILAEINPLIITSNDEVIALDSRIGIDDDATFRHSERKEWLSQTLRYTPEEKDAKDHGLIYVDLGGEIGMLSVGAGLGMATADIIESFGGAPRNFLDVGGGASPDKVEHALRIMIRSGGVKSILINAFGGITRLDDVAKGIIDAKNKYEVNIPLVIRLNGTNQEIAVKMLEDAGMFAYLEMEPAVEKAVELAKGN